MRTLLKGLGFATLLYVIWRLFKWRFYRGRREELKRRWDRLRMSGESPPRVLWVVVNGLLGSTESGSHIVDMLVEAARRKGMLDVAAMRVQASDVWFGVNVYSKGMVVAADAVVQEVESMLRQYPSLEEVSFLGNSFGSLVLRLAARKLWEGRRCSLGVYISFPAPNVGISERTWLKMSFLKRQLIQHMPFGVFNDLLLRGDQPVIVDLSAGDTRYLSAFRKRVCLASVHDTTVPFEEACFWAWPCGAEKRLEYPPHDPGVASSVLGVAESTLCEPPLGSSSKERAIAKVDSLSLSLLFSHHDLLLSFQGIARGRVLVNCSCHRRA